MNVIELRFLNPEDRVYFRGKWRKMLTGGRDTRNDEIPGLNMSLNPNTGLVSVDAPGDSIVLHVSAVSPRLKPSISEATEPAPMVPSLVPKAPARSHNVAAPAPVTAADLGYDPNGEDIDDRDVARLLQGKGAKKKLEAKAKKKPGPKPKVKAAPVSEPSDYADDDSSDDEGDDA